MTDADTPAIRARYYIVTDAEIVDVAKSLAAGRVVCSSGRCRAGWAPHHDQDALPAAMALEHVRACRQRAAGRRGRGARTRREGRRRALFLFRSHPAGSPPAAARIARQPADQRSPIRPRSIPSRCRSRRRHPDSRLDDGDEPRLLGSARESRARSGSITCLSPASGRPCHDRRGPQNDGTSISPA